MAVYSLTRHSRNSSNCIRQLRIMRPADICDGPLTAGVFYGFEYAVDRLVHTLQVEGLKITSTGILD